MSYLGKHNDTCVFENSQHRFLSLSPRATTWQRMKVQYKKWGLPSYKHPHIKTILKSEAAFVAEKRKFVKEGHALIIHPFSVFAMMRDVFMFVIWSYTYFVNPYMLAFHSGALGWSVPIHRYLAWWICRYILAGITFLYIAINFCMGYVNKEHHTVELGWNKIIKHYIITYWVFDMINATRFIVLPTLAVLSKDYKVLITSMFYIMIQLVRFQTYFKYFEILTNLLKLTHRTYSILCHMILHFVIIHYCVCFLFMICIISSKFDKKIAMFVLIAHKSTHEQYLTCLHKTIALLIGADSSKNQTEYPAEYIVYSLILIVGYLLRVYTMLFILRTFYELTSSVTRYGLRLKALEDYMIQKKMPARLKFKLLVYFKSRYRNYFFEEERIFACLSHNLTHDIFQFRSSGIQKSEFLNSLSKVALNELLIGLEICIYMPNDIIMRFDEDADAIYFISYGTVALFEPSGEEIRHNEAGSVVGMVNMFTKKFYVNAVAVDVVEMFVWPKDKVIAIREKYPEVDEQIKAYVENRLQLLHARSYYGDEFRNSIFGELNAGKILDHQQRRKANI